MKITQEMAEGVISEARQDLAERDSRGSSGPNVFWIDDGSYWIRPYPEIINGRLLTMETMYIYSYPGIGIFTYEEGGPLEKEYERARSQLSSNPFRLDCREIGKIRCFVTKAMPESQYVKVGEPQILVGGWALVDQWKRFIGGLDPQNLMEILDPDTESHLIRIDWKRGSRGSKTTCNLGIDMRKEKAPELPSDFPSVMDAYITKNTTPSEEQLSKIRAHVSETILKSVKISDPESESRDANEVAESLLSSSESSSDSSRDSGGVDKSLASCLDPDVQKDHPGIEFGKHPVEICPACIMCPIENYCLDQTPGE